jgi:hypothetical protein
MTKRRLGTLALAITLLPSSSSAQEWLKDRRYSEGAGIRAGDYEIHPGIAAEGGYDSNWFSRSNNSGPNVVNGAPANPPVGVGMLRVTPSLTLSTLGPQRMEGEVEPQKLRLRAGLSATYREFFGDDFVRTQRNISGTFQGRADILPGRPWSGGLTASFTRTVQPTVAGDPNLSFTRDDLGAGGELVVQPGGGTLDWHFGYQFRMSFFESSLASPYTNITQEGSTRGRWKFRPRTALLYDATLRFISYPNSASLQGSLRTSTPVRTRLGINGLVTPRLSVLAMAGWASSFFATSGTVNMNQFDGPIAQVEVTLYLSANPGGDDAKIVSLAISSLSLGYTRDFANSLLGDYFGLDRGYLRASFFFANRALVTGDVGVGVLQYPSLLFSDGTLRANAFTDIRADATLFAEYRFVDSLGINVTGRYSQNFSKTLLRVDPTSTQAYDLNWQRLEAYLGVRWFM